MIGAFPCVGAAAHAMCPSPGQGARTAFEDAHQLCLALRAGMDPQTMAQTIKRYRFQLLNHEVGLLFICFRRRVVILSQN